MKISAIVGLLLILSMGDAAHAAPAGAELLWHDGQQRIQTVKCAENRSDGGDHCLAIQVADGVGDSIVGDQYAWVNLLWSKKPGQSGPDALLLGDFGGSSGLSDLIAVRFSPRAIVWKIRVAPGEAVTVDHGRNSLCLNLPFGIGGFNQASYADSTSVQIPVCWSSGAFVLNSKALLARAFPNEDLRFRELAIGYELRQWARDSYPASDLYPIKTTWGTPVTARALVDLMLSGHADVAREILHKSWPATQADLSVPMGGEKHFWGALCRLIVKKQDWSFFHLDRLPHADLIEEGAKSAEN